MSTTPRLGLHRPGDTDLFLTADFDADADNLDAHPGIYVCTSSTKPTWGANQAGSWIFCTDTRTALAWSGSAWQEPFTDPPMWTLHTTINSSVTANSGDVFFSLGSITALRDFDALAILQIDRRTLPIASPYTIAWGMDIGGAGPISGFDRIQDSNKGETTWSNFGGWGNDEQTINCVFALNSLYAGTDAARLVVNYQTPPSYIAIPGGPNVAPPTLDIKRTRLTMVAVNLGPS